MKLKNTFFILGFSIFLTACGKQGVPQSNKTFDLSNLPSESNQFSTEITKDISSTILDTSYSNDIIREIEVPEIKNFDKDILKGVKYGSIPLLNIYNLLEAQDDIYYTVETFEDMSDAEEVIDALDEMFFTKDEDLIDELGSLDASRNFIMDCQARDSNFFHTEEELLEWETAEGYEIDKNDLYEREVFKTYEGDFFGYEDLKIEATFNRLKNDIEYDIRTKDSKSIELSTEDYSYEYRGSEDFSFKGQNAVSLDTYSFIYISYDGDDEELKNVYLIDNYGNEF